MNFNFLDDFFSGLGSGLADTDKFVKREMPFDSGWGAPAALAAAIAAPEIIPYFAEAGAAEGAGAAAGAEGSIGSGGMNSLLSSLGLESGSFPAQETFQLPMQSYTPEYLNTLADYQGVQAEDKSIWDIITGNTEQGAYDREAKAGQQAGKTVKEMLKNRQQQSALNQLGKTSSGMQQQGQQAKQNRMAQQQAMMRRGQGVDTTTALLSLLQDRQQSRQPRISLI